MIVFECVKLAGLGYYFCEKNLYECFYHTEVMFVICDAENGRTFFKIYELGCGNRGFIFL